AGLEGHGIGRPRKADCGHDAKAAQRKSDPAAGAEGGTCEHAAAPRKEERSDRTNDNRWRAGLTADVGRPRSRRNPHALQDTPDIGEASSSRPAKVCVAWGFSDGSTGERGCVGSTVPSAA